VKPTTKTPEDLVKRLLGGIAFEAPAGVPRGCCLKALAHGGHRRTAAGARYECPECGQVVKAVLLGAGRAGRDDVLARGPGAGTAIAKESDTDYRIAGTFVSKEYVSPPELEAALSRAGFSPGALVESEFGWWAGGTPD
jgi:hypothetical protein